MESMFNLQPFNEKMENSEIYIFIPKFSKSWIHQIAHMKILNH